MIGAAVNVYVTGYSGEPLFRDYATLKYNASTGATQWTGTNGARRYDRAGGDDNGRAIAVAGSGNCYVTGEASSTTGEVFDYSTVRYDKDGNQVGSAIVFPSDGQDYARSIAVSCAGNVSVAGWVADGANYETVKYTQPVQSSTVLTTLTVNTGTVVGGDVNSLRNDGDSNVLDFQVGIAIDPLVQFTIEGSSDYSAPSELCLQVVSQSTLVAYSQVVEFYDYDSAQWRQMDTRRTTIGTYTTLNCVSRCDPNRFVSAGNAVKARITFNVVQPWLGSPHIKIDKANWQILP